MGANGITRVCVGRIINEKLIKMDRIKLEEIYKKHVNGFLQKDRMARFEDIPTRIFIDAMEEAVRIQDVVGRSEQFTFEDMRNAFDAGAWEHHIHDFDSWIKTQK